MFKIVLLISAFMVSIPVSAQQYVFPAQGQSPEQQKQDEAACYNWAVENSGYDPANPPDVQVATQPSGPSGARVRGAAKGDSKSSYKNEFFYGGKTSTNNITG